MMGGRTRKKVGAALAVGLAIGGTVALTSSSASGVFTETTDPFYEPFGRLTIELGDRSGRLVFDPVATGAPTVFQPLINEQPCNQVRLDSVSEGTGDLLGLVALVNGLTGPGDSVQQPGEFFGVQAAGENCGQQSAVIGPDELLEIALGSFFSPDVRVRSLTAAVDKKFNNDGNLTVGFDGGAQDLEKPVATGGSTVSIPDTDIPGGVFTSVTFGSTSNKDNRGLAIGDATLELVTASDEFDFAVFCGEQVPATVVGGGDIAQSATYSRLDNKNNEDCEDVGVKVEIQGMAGSIEERVFWNNDSAGVVTGGTQRVQALFTIVWRPTADPADLERTIDYDGDESNGYSGTMLWCAGRDGAGIPILPTFTGHGAIDVDPGTGVDDVDLRAPWCLVDDIRDLDTSGKIAQTQTLFGSGDPWAR